jgi:hypothetical protein
VNEEAQYAVAQWGKWLLSRGTGNFTKRLLTKRILTKRILTKRILYKTYTHKPDFLSLLLIFLRL